MNINKLLRFATLFYSIAAAEELPEDSSDLPTVLKNLSKLETYGARKKYAEKNLKHLSSGSSRIVYLSSQDTIIKLAKNDKGVAQNKAESNPKMKSSLVNKVKKHSDNFAWIEVDFIDKITNKEFEKMTGLDFDDFGESIRYGLKSVSGNTDREKPENFDEIEKSDLYKELKDLGKEFELMPGDLARISSWGKKDGKPILIDVGLTKEVFAEFYES